MPEAATLIARPRTSAEHVPQSAGGGIVHDTLTIAGRYPHSQSGIVVVSSMTKKKRAGHGKTRDVEETTLGLAGAELGRRTGREIADAGAPGAVKLRGFGSRDAARRPPSRTRVGGRRRPRGLGQHG